MGELILVPCNACAGDGYTFGLGGASGDGLPAETTCPCDACGGMGKVEVCEGCLEVPTVAGGLELCGCVTVLLRRAA